MTPAEPVTSSDPHQADAVPPPATNAAPPTDELPEPFILTPEYVEEEAIRGDFVIRWAAVLFGVLMGWTHVTSTTTLLRIRTGQELAAHGMLPPRTDEFFSYTAGDRPWVNLAWLGDLLLGGVYGLGGDLLLSALCGVLSGVAFWLVSRTSLPRVSTWWGSICGALAAIAAFPLLTPGPTLITVVGLALTLFLLQAWRDRPESGRLWWLVPVLLVWSNLDERAFLGVMVVALYAVGHTLRGALPSSQGRWWLPVVVAIAAALVNPFPLHVVRSPVQLVQTFYPLMREHGGQLTVEFPALWRPVFDEASWRSPAWHTLAAVGLAGLALVTFVVNYRRLGLGRLLVFLGLNAYGLLAGLDFAAVAVVNAVLATLNGQEWYRDNWRQEYSTAPSELLLGRVGRAATVLSLFVAAYWVVSGHMTGANGRRVGFGFSQSLEARIRGYQELLGHVPDDEFDDHPFAFTPEQGDLLVWLGRRSFTDSRLALFAAPGEADLLLKQREIAASLAGPGAREASAAQFHEWTARWQGLLNEYGITHVVIPLDTDAGYRLWVNMASQGVLIDDRTLVRFWQAVKVSGPAAVLYRLDAPAGEADRLTAFLRRHSHPSVVAETFRPETDGVAVQRGLFPRAPNFYETTLLLPDRFVSNEVLTARHYALRLTSADRPLGETLAYCHQVIRHARRGLAEDANQLDAYLLLGDAYSQLWRTESSLTGGNPYGAAAAERRFYEAIFALHHALVCDPARANTHAALYPLYLSHGDYDLALRHLDRLHDLTGFYTLVPKDAPGFSQFHQNGKRLRDQLDQAVEESKLLIDQALGAGGPELAVRAAMQVGCPGLALETLEHDLTLVAGSVPLSEQYAGLLLLNGRTSDGFDQAIRLYSAVEAARKPQVATTAARAWLAADNMDQAITLFDEVGDDRCRQLLEASAATLPLTSNPAPQNDAWPVFQIMTGFEGLTRWIPDWERTQWQVAMCHLEQGRNLDAGTVLQGVLASDAATPLRPLVAVYLTMLTGQEVPFVPPGSALPVLRHPDRPPSPRPSHRNP